MFKWERTIYDKETEMSQCYRCRRVARRRRRAAHIVTTVRTHRISLVCSAESLMSVAYVRVQKT